MRIPLTLAFTSASSLPRLFCMTTRYGPSSLFEAFFTVRIACFGVTFMSYFAPGFSSLSPLNHVACKTIAPKYQNDELFMDDSSFVIHLKKKVAVHIESSLGMVQSSEHPGLPSIRLLSRTNVNICPIPVCLLGWTVYVGRCTAQPQGYTKMCIPCVCVPYVYWKMGCMRTLHRFSTDFASHLWLIYIAGDGLEF